MKSKSLSGRVEIYIGKDLKKAVIDSGLNLSQFVREKLEEYFKAHGIEIKREEPELVLLVRCPSYGFKNPPKGTISIENAQENLAKFVLGIKN